MKYIIYYFIITILFIFPNFVNSNTLLSQSATITSLHFVDSEKGISVQPGFIQIINKLNNEIIIFAKKEEISNYGKISLNLPIGDYAIIVSAQGYNTFHSSLNIYHFKESVHKIFLDPLVNCSEFDINRIRKMQKQNHSIIMGFVVDDETGTPISNVLISSLIDEITTSTDINGFYFANVPNRDCSAESYTDLVFERSSSVSANYKYLENNKNDITILNVRMSKGVGENAIDQRKYRKRLHESKIKNDDCFECQNDNKENITNDNYYKFTSPFMFDAVAIPATIRVGRNCTGTNCTTVEYYTLETYCKYVLPAEIYGCWGGLSGGMNSLQAIAVSVRTYGLWYIYNPLSPSYDICDNTYCQVFGSIQNSYCNSAVDNTARYILVNSSGYIVKSEYSAENNNAGCGNGYSGTGSTWPCIYDPACLNYTNNGHGRGLCQWGSIRWATGTNISTSNPCNLGPSHGFGTKTWQGILSHYYPIYTLTQGGTSSILSVSPTPATSSPCSTIVIQYSINSTSQMSLMLAASIRKNGTTTWISDPAHDLKIQIPSGNSNQSRLFTIPCSALTGLYDMLTALWFDKDNNNIIDATDLIMSSLQLNNILNIQVSSGQASIQSGITINPNPVNLGSTFTSSFTLKETQGNPVTYDTITCAILKNDYTFCFDMQRYSNITISANGTWNYNSTGVLNSPQYQAGTYRAVGRGKRNGSWSDFGITGGGQNNITFLVQNALLPPPVLVNPNGIIYTTTPTFQWQAVAGALKYGLYVSIYPYGSTNIVYSNENIPGNSTSFTIPSGYLFYGNQYRWNMGTYNSSNQLGTISTPLYFQTQLPSGIALISNEIPKKNELYENFPNPFNPVTKINFDIAKKSDVNITIFDINGRLIKDISQNELIPGKYTYLFDASSLCSGIYFYRLSTSDFRKTIKLTLIK